MAFTFRGRSISKIGVIGSGHIGRKERGMVSRTVSGEAGDGKDYEFRERGLTHFDFEMVLNANACSTSAKMGIGGRIF